ncbi:hypothetical protein [Streptomyces sp. NPDC001661]
MTPAAAPSARAQHVVTSGTFSLDGDTFDVDNNVWLIGDDEEVLVVELSATVGSPPVLLHPADVELWQTVYPRRKPDGELAAVLTGHGPDTTVDAERAHVPAP